MPWVEKKPKPDKSHKCRQPKIRPWTRVGATWMCDECEWIWMVVRIPDPASGGSYKVWEIDDSRTEYQRSWAEAEALRKRLDASVRSFHEPNKEDKDG